MLLPFHRDALRERAHLDAADEADAYARTTPSERMERCFELSELASELAQSVGSDWPERAAADLAEKARLFAAPLRAVAR